LIFAIFSLLAIFSVPTYAEEYEPELHIKCEVSKWSSCEDGFQHRNVSCSFEHHLGKHIPPTVRKCNNQTDIQYDITSSFETSANDECYSPVNHYRGTCVKATECKGATFNDQCPGRLKCCVQDSSAPSRYTNYVDYSVFTSLFENAGSIRSQYLHPWFNNALTSLLEYTSPQQRCHIIAAFSAQVGHESVGLLYFEEIASGEEYEGRCKDLGNCERGDGKKYKGRGPIQLTGRSNYKSASLSIGMDYVAVPDVVCFPEHGFKTTVWYWTKKNLNQYCTGSYDDFVSLTKRINGGTNGLQNRLDRWNTAKTILKC
jgi:predicted chitinase